MLLSLHIENLAIINRIDIDFTDGFMVLTGETGAGKSIIIDGINLLLGAKANKELISFCSKLLDVNKSKIEIISGEKSKLKKVLIKDTKLDEITQKLIFVLDSLHKGK